MKRTLLSIISILFCLPIMGQNAYGITTDSRLILFPFDTLSAKDCNYGALKLTESFFKKLSTQLDNIDCTRIEPEYEDEYLKNWLRAQILKHPKLNESYEKYRKHIEKGDSTRFQSIDIVSAVDEKRRLLELYYIKRLLSNAVYTSHDTINDTDLGKHNDNFFFPINVSINSKDRGIGPSAMYMDYDHDAFSSYFGFASNFKGDKFVNSIYSNGYFVDGASFSLVGGITKFKHDFSKVEDINTLSDLRTLKGKVKNYWTAYFSPSYTYRNYKYKNLTAIVDTTGTMRNELINWTVGGNVYLESGLLLGVSLLWGEDDNYDALSSYSFNEDVSLTSGKTGKKQTTYIVHNELHDSTTYNKFEYWRVSTDMFYSSTKFPIGMYINPFYVFGDEVGNYIGLSAGVYFLKPNKTTDPTFGILYEHDKRGGNRQNTVSLVLNLQFGGYGDRVSAKKSIDPVSIDD